MLELCQTFKSARAGRTRDWLLRRWLHLEEVDTFVPIACGVVWCDVCRLSCGWYNYYKYWPVTAGIYPSALLEIQTQNAIVTALRPRGQQGMATSSFFRGARFFFPLYLQGPPTSLGVKLHHSSLQGQEVRDAHDLTFSSVDMTFLAVLLGTFGGACVCVCQGWHGKIPSSRMCGLHSTLLYSHSPGSWKFKTEVSLFSRGLTKHLTGVCTCMCIQLSFCADPTSPLRMPGRPGQAWLSSFPFT